MQCSSIANIQLRSLPLVLTLFLCYLHQNSLWTDGQQYPPLECDANALTGDCLRGIFHRYSNSEIMNYDQFSVFLRNIGLGISFDIDHSEDDHHMEDDDVTPTEDPSLWDDHTFDKHLQCLSPPKLLATVGLHQTDMLNTSHFMKLCPILVQQLDVHACENRLTQSDHHDHEDADDQSEKDTRYIHEVWGFSVAAITVISLASLLCILMVPCIQGYPVAFQRLLAFLVALAVGTLSGDAILHLIPHSFIPHGHSQHGTNTSSGAIDHEEEELSSSSTERLVIFKGLAVLAGIFVFFVFEQLLQYFTKTGSTVEHVKDYKPNNHNIIGSKLAEHRDSSQEVLASPASPGYASSDSHVQLCVTYTPTEDKELMLSPTYPKIEHNSVHPIVDGSDHQASYDRRSSSSMIHGHGHSHGGHQHGHSHNAGSISSIAWIVVLGDSMHNFCDGLVVGSAFVDSFAGGLSTSIAIMCHEIPHELGDFAVLLKGGMTIKQALLVQLLSSIMAYLGMAIGVAVGNVSSASTWMFALAAGMFLYIALVDLVPEMVDSAKSSVGSHCVHLGLQAAGVILGLCLMMMIALGEPTMLELLGG